MSITERELPAVGGSHHKLQTCVNHTSNCGTENAFVRFCIDVHAPPRMFLTHFRGFVDFCSHVVTLCSFF